MTTQEVANGLIDLCKQGKFMEALHSLCSKDMVSVEARPMPDGSREMQGIDKLIEKSDWFEANHEIHSTIVEGPLVAGPFFTVRFIFDMTHKPSAKRMTFDELAVYKVEDGKIVREEFFYA